MKRIVQSVLIDKRVFTLPDSINEVTKRGYKVKKIDETTDYYRFRQVEPKKSFKYYFENLDNGVKLIWAY